MEIPVKIEDGDEALHKLNEGETLIEAVLEHLYMYESQEDTIENDTTMMIRDLGQKFDSLTEKIRKAIHESMSS